MMAKDEAECEQEWLDMLAKDPTLDEECRPTTLKERIKLHLERQRTETFTADSEEEEERRIDAILDARDAIRDVEAGIVLGIWEFGNLLV